MKVDCRGGVGRKPTSPKTIPPIKPTLLEMQTSYSLLSGVLSATVGYGQLTYGWYVAFGEDAHP
jgi:hypothetical protein